MGESKRIDADLRGAVLQALMLDGAVPPTVDARVTEGVVRLVGTTDRQQQRDEAEFVAGNVLGVLGLVNEIRLTAPVRATYKNRSSGPSNATRGSTPFRCGWRRRTARSRSPGLSPRGRNTMLRSAPPGRRRASNPSSTSSLSSSDGDSARPARGHDQHRPTGVLRDLVREASLDQLTEAS
jgi:BON domain-containing protein